MNSNLLFINIWCKKFIGHKVALSPRSKLGTFLRSIDFNEDFDLIKIVQKNKQLNKKM